MSFTDEIIALLNKVYRTCPFTEIILTPVGNLMDSVNNYIYELKCNFFFDTLNEDGCAYFEALLGITKTSDDVEIRRAYIQSRWTSSNNNSITLIQNILDAWCTNEAEADFTGGRIVITFNEFISSEKFNNIIATIEFVKPAHLPLSFTYNTAGDSSVYAGAGVKEHIKTVFYCLE